MAVALVRERPVWRGDRTAARRLRRDSLGPRTMVRSTVRMSSRGVGTTWPVAGAERASRDRRRVFADD